MKWRHSVANGGWTGRGVKVRDSSTRQTTPSQILDPWSRFLDFYPWRWERVLRGRRLDPRSRDDWQDSWGRLHCLHGWGHMNYICNYFLLQNITTLDSWPKYSTTDGGCWQVRLQDRVCRLVCFGRRLSAWGGENHHPATYGGGGSVKTHTNKKLSTILNLK